MSEEQVFNKYVLNSENNHQFVIVIGSSGAGKSHLIRWFAARLDQAALENEVVLFVRRSDNSLKGTIKQLLELPEVANIQTYFLKYSLYSFHMLQKVKLFLT